MALRKRFQFVSLLTLSLLMTAQTAFAYSYDPAEFEAKSSLFIQRLVRVQGLEGTAKSVVNEKLPSALKTFNLMLSVAKKRVVGDTKSVEARSDLSDFAQASQNLVANYIYIKEMEKMASSASAGDMLPGLRKAKLQIAIAIQKANLKGFEPYKQVMIPNFQSGRGGMDTLEGEIPLGAVVNLLYAVLNDLKK